MITKITYVKAKRTKIFDNDKSKLFISEPNTENFTNDKEAIDFLIGYLSEPRVTKTEKVATVETDDNGNVSIVFDIIEKI